MGWSSMPSDVIDTSLDRYIVEGKAFEATPEFDVQDGVFSWLYIQTPPDKSTILYSVVYTATNGPVRALQYPQPVLVGELGEHIVSEPLNQEDTDTSGTVIHKVADGALDTTDSVPESRRLIPATSAGGQRGIAAATGITKHKILAPNDTYAIRLEIEQGVNQGYVEIHLQWAEDTR